MKSFYNRFMELKHAFKVVVLKLRTYHIMKWLRTTSVRPMVQNILLMAGLHEMREHPAMAQLLHHME